MLWWSLTAWSHGEEKSTRFPRVVPQTKAKLETTVRLVKCHFDSYIKQATIYKREIEHRKVAELRRHSQFTVMRVTYWKRFELSKDWFKPLHKNSLYGVFT